MHDKLQPQKGCLSRYICACCRQEVDFAQQEVCVMLSDQLGMLVCRSCEQSLLPHELSDAISHACMTEVSVSAGFDLHSDDSDLASYSDISDWDSEESPDTDTDFSGSH
ncbi:E7 [Chelonia mydas papillomavirus 1]|uniref:E7 n=1 Tax=Chelonia mydas papillomavirus 1 TaxID=485242 RepID=B6RUP2_9PAPI|nr:E7 [Chelonia mydas papillomavirus 1]QJX58434.1 E7 [Chelonia mydas papillomavirus 1]QJX58441.1 E7 [Chelonia mydas papillomavirus 1]